MERKLTCTRLVNIPESFAYPSCGARFLSLSYRLDVVIELTKAPTLRESCSAMYRPKCRVATKSS